MNRIYKITFIYISLILVQSCTAYSTNLNEAEKFQVSTLSDIKTGEACSNNLFGGFSLPYFGDTAIRLKGDESVISAIKNANITSVYAVDRRVRNYIFYSKRCTIVFGRLKEPELKVKEIPTVANPDSTTPAPDSTSTPTGSTTTPSVPGLAAPSAPSAPSMPGL